MNKPLRWWNGVGKAVQLTFMLCGVAVVSCLLLSACVDGRIKEAASLVNVKTSVTAKEYKAAKTPEEKIKIADEYFDTAPRLTQVLEDHMYGREPAQ